MNNNTNLSINNAIRAGTTSTLKKQTMREIPKSYIQKLCEGIRLNFVQSKKDKRSNKKNKLTYSLIPPETAGTMVLNRKDINIIADIDSDDIWVWTKNTSIHSIYGSEILDTIIAKSCRGHYRSAYVKEIKKYIITLKKTKVVDSGKIACNNGILAITANKVTLSTFTPDFFIKNKINVNFNPHSKNPEFEKFIDQICPVDRLLLQEVAGYLLIKGYPIHSIVWLYGELGNNGKGTFVRILRDIIGSENCSNISMESLCGNDNFARYEMRNSLWNVSPECRTTERLSVEPIQSMIGEDYHNANIKKIQKRPQIKNEAKLFYMGNTPLPIYNPPIGFWEKLIVCHFPNTFLGKDANVNLEKELTSTENKRAYILNWMIAGAQRLIQNGMCFSGHGSLNLNKDNYATLDNPLDIFIDEMIDTETDAITSNSIVNECYRLFCKKHNVAPKGDLRKAITSKFPFIEYKRSRTNGENRWSFVGLKLLPNLNEDDKTNQCIKCKQCLPILQKRQDEPELQCWIKPENVPSVPNVPEVYIGNKKCVDKKIILNKKRGTIGTVGTANKNTKMNSKYTNHETIPNSHNRKTKKTTQTATTLTTTKSIQHNRRHNNE